MNWWQKAIYELGLDVKLTKNFSSQEFACHDGAAVPIKLLNEHTLPLCKNLEIIRSEFEDRPIFIISGYRTKSHNAKVGGVRNSQHLIAGAADIKVKGLKPKEVGAKIRQMMRSGKIAKGGVGIYNNFVHVDIRGRYVTWKGK